ncbi:MAG TPA: hypothetical protein VEA99_04930, partial [Gemmatimonadaceae bacterium]|nr:hypothetical protein [Gemmatimonadaceae bacterium]
MRSLLWSRVGRALLPAVALVVAACSTDTSAPSTGALAVRVEGLPTGTPAAITIWSADVAVRMLATSETLDELPPDDYTLTADPVTARAGVYRPQVPRVPVRVVAGESRSTVVAYQIVTGSVVVQPTGLPATVPGRFVLTGPAGYLRVIAGGDTITGLEPGRYAVAAEPVSLPEDSWTPTVPATEIDVVAAEAPTTLPLPFRLVTGRIAIDATDLPADAGTPIRISGPHGVDVQVGRGALVTGLAPGRYTVAARTVYDGGAPLAGVPAVQTVDVQAGETPARASLRYTRRPPLDLTIAGLSIVQTVQRPDNSIPLVEGKPGLLRVRVLASEANVETPAVRVRFYRGAQLLREATIAAPGEGAPTTDAPLDLASTWNLVVEGELLRPGVSVQAEVDPTDRVAEQSDANNRWPAAAPHALDVRSVPRATIRLVPITQGGLTGDAGAGESIAELAHRLYPLGELRVETRAPFATSAPLLEASDRNGAWQSILSELLALRVAESTADTYLGLLQLPYSGGVAGM